jgi:calcium channel MID1
MWSILASFSCPLVYALPYCPTVSYAVPLPPPPAPALAYDSTLLPSSLTGPLVQYMSNFTTTLLSLACGRDLYSPLVTCAECQSAYRTWLCTISFTRCSEPAPGSAISSSIPAPTATGIAALWQTLGSTNQQVPISALVPQPTSSTPRNPNLPNMTTEYTALLPCLEVCTAADRACPSALGFRCPHPRFNAAASYGVGYIDQGADGVQGHGITGVAQDQWGNLWCNGI